MDPCPVSRETRPRKAGFWVWSRRRAAVLAIVMPIAGAAFAEDSLPRQEAALSAGVLQRKGEATFRHSPSDLGGASDAFDGRPTTSLRTRAVNPAFLEVTFREPRTVVSAEAFFPGGARHEWSLLAGEDPENLALLFSRRPVGVDLWSGVETLRRPVTARIFRVVVKRLEGDDHVHFGEIVLTSEQRPIAIDLETSSTVVTPDGALLLRARVTWDGGYRTLGVHGLRFETAYELEAGRTARIEDRAAPGTVAVRYERAGPLRVRAVLRNRTGDLASPWLDLRAEPLGRPDWAVTHIERTPRLPFDGPGGGLPPPDTNVTYVAHVKNYGTSNAPRVPVLWEVDGVQVESGFLDGLNRFEEGTVTLRLPWTGKRREVRFTVDPGERVPETSEGNNRRAVATDALLLGLWVERPLLAWFHRTQAEFGDGANGWEDWAQRQVDRWNAMLRDAKHPLTPAGVADRVALDRIVVVDEGALPLSGGLPANDPDSRDRTVDLMWGFPATLLDSGFYARRGEKSDDNPLWFEGSLLHELSRARYLVDLHRLDVAPGEVRLAGADGAPVAGTDAMPVVDAHRVHATAGGRMMTSRYAEGYSAHEARALERIAGRRARGGNRSPPPTRGEYLGDLPGSCRVLVRDGEGRPIPGVRVRAWRRVADGEGGSEFRGEPVREGMTAPDGTFDLALDGRDPFFEGRRGGGLDIGQGVLILSLSRGGKTAWRFLEVVPFNLAFWGGSTERHDEPVTVELLD